MQFWFEMYKPKTKTCSFGKISVKIGLLTVTIVIKLTQWIKDNCTLPNCFIYHNARINLCEFQIQTAWGMIFSIQISAPQKKNAVSADLSHTENVLLSWKTEEITADDKSSSISKGSIYYIKHIYIQPFSMEVDLREIWH